MTPKQKKRLMEILRLRDQGVPVHVMQDDDLFFRVGDSDKWEPLGSPEDVLRTIFEAKAITWDKV